MSTIFWPFIGGTLVGLASVILLLVHGQIAGVSGIFGGLDNKAAWQVPWRALFLLGLIGGGLLVSLWYPAQFGLPSVSLGGVIVAGLAVGIGTRLGNGCTSGHGVCGIGRAAPRSVVATASFVGTGIVTATFLHFVGWTV